MVTVTTTFAKIRVVLVTRWSVTPATGQVLLATHLEGVQDFGNDGGQPKHPNNNDHDSNGNQCTPLRAVWDKIWDCVHLA
jgi:hypothetical protein